MRYSRLQNQSVLFAMRVSDTRLVLLPGLDGTGELFLCFRRQLPAELEVRTVRYPNDRVRGYNELRPFVIEACEGAKSVVLFAESFSSPLAIEIAAPALRNLSGLILCAGFAAPPIDGIARTIVRNVPEGLFRFSLPQWAIRRYLVGSDAPAALIRSVEEAVRDVPPQILRHRLNEVLTKSVIGSLSQLKSPTLYIQASEDRLVRSAAFRKIAAANPNVRKHVVSGPHLVAQANPSAVAAVVLNFLRTLA